MDSSFRPVRLFIRDAVAERDGIAQEEDAKLSILLALDFAIAESQRVGRDHHPLVGFLGVRREPEHEQWIGDVVEPELRAFLEVRDAERIEDPDRDLRRSQQHCSRRETEDERPPDPVESPVEDRMVESDGPDRDGGETDQQREVGYRIASEDPRMKRHVHGEPQQDCEAQRSTPD